MAWSNLFNRIGDGYTLQWQSANGDWINVADQDPPEGATVEVVNGILKVRNFLIGPVALGGTSGIRIVPSTFVQYGGLRATTQTLNMDAEVGDTFGGSLDGLYALSSGFEFSTSFTSATQWTMPVALDDLETNPVDLFGGEGADWLGPADDGDGSVALTWHLAYQTPPFPPSTTDLGSINADFLIEIDVDPFPPGPGGSATNFNCECDGGPANKTLAAYRRDLLIRCGFAAVANNPPPGTRELMDAFLRDAQDFLYHKYPALHTRRFFRWTMEEGQRFYGILQNDDSTQPRIPVTFSADSDDTLRVSWNNYVAPPDGRVVFFTPTEGSALPYGLSPNTAYFVANGGNGESDLALTPGGDPITVILEAYTTGVSHGYAEMRQAIFDLSPYKNIEGAWLVDLNGSWLPMTCGIPPTFYTTVSQPGLPVRYEIRSCIEVFPAPAAAYSLYVKGHFGLRPFELDSDKPTIDGKLVYLWGLANALDYYGKPSAAGIAEQARDYLGQLVAGTHTGKRYIPGTQPLPPAILPIFAPWPGGDP
jgi:hypothetical protein